MTTIAKGVVRIDGKDNTQAAFNSAKKSAISLEKAMKVAAAAVVAVAGAKAMGKLIGNTLDLADAIGKLSKNTGISVEFIQVYSRVMGEAGITQQQSEKSLLTFSKRLGEMKLGFGAMKGPISKYSEELYQQLLATENSEEAVKIFIAALEGIEDPATQASLAAAAFDTRVGKEMPAALKGGAGAFDKAAKDIMKSTTLLTQSQIELAEKANDQMSRVGYAWKSMKDAVVVQAAGPIVAACEWILDTAWPAVQKFTQYVGEAWDKYAAPGVSKIVEFFEFLYPIIKPALDTLVKAVQIQFAVIGKVWELVKPGLEKFTNMLIGVWDVVGPPVEAGVKIIGEAFGLILGFVNSALDAVQGWVDGTTTLLGAAGQIWDSWIATVKAAVDLFTKTFDGILGPVKASLDAVWSVVESVVNKIKEKFEWVSKAIEKTWGFITGLFSKGAKDVKKEAEGMTSDVVKSAEKLTDGVEKEFKTMEVNTYKRFRGMRGAVNKEGEGMVDDAFGHSWAKDLQVGVNQQFQIMADGSVATMKSMRQDVEAEGLGIQAAYIESLNNVVVNTDQSFSEVEDRAKQMRDDVEDSMSDMFVDFLNGDIEDGIKGFFDRLVDMAKKAAADMAAEFVMNKLFGGLGGGSGSGAGILGGLFKGGGGGASGLFSKVGGLFKGGSAAGSSGWASSITAPGAGGGAATAGGAGGVAAAAVPLAIFGFGMYMSKKQAKKDKENYLKIINDIELAENLATENITQGYNLLGQRGEEAFVQIDEATAKHMETMNIGAERVSTITDEYGNVIMKAQEFDAFTKDVQWAEMHMDVVDSLKEINAHYGELGVHGQEATTQIQMATQALINDQQMSVKMTEAMADGYISAGEAMEMGLASAAGLTSEEFKKVVDGSNAIVTGVNKMSAESLKAFSQIDASSGMAAAALSDGFVSSLDMSRLGFSELGAMSSDMFHSMIQYAQQATTSMNGLANAAGNAGGAARGVPGFMTGGSFMVGGKGGLDNNIVAFKASNNERVTVETPAQQRSNDSRGGFGSIDVKDLIEYVTKPIVGAVQKQSVIAAANARH